ncbi:hypothetical protein [Rhodosalinus sp. FB01]|uniref:hypothetical protein n=1 Tax=Rhodosalinus sp. FB01 TaxID=3239194 RepID=UPI003523B37D
MFHELTIAEVRHETPDSVALSFAVPDELKDAFAWQPGQYLTLRAEVGGATSAGPIPSRRPPGRRLP